MKNFEPYIKMAAQGKTSKEIIKVMAQGLDIQESTARRYYYQKVKPLSLIERRNDIPPVYMQDTSKRVRFSEAEKERIRQEAGVYLDGTGKRKIFNPGNRKVK